MNLKLQHAVITLIKKLIKKMIKKLQYNTIQYKIILFCQGLAGGPRCDVKHLRSVVPRSRKTKTGEHEKQLTKEKLA